MPRKVVPRQKQSISCLNCRKTKRKCDGNSPCKLCDQRGKTCEYDDEDKRRKRPAVAYVQVLENSNAEMVRTLKRLKSLSSNPQDLLKVLNEINVDPNTTPNTDPIISSHLSITNNDSNDSTVTDTIIRGESQDFNNQISQSSLRQGIKMEKNDNKSDDDDDNDEDEKEVELSINSSINRITTTDRQSNESVTPESSDKKSDFESNSQKGFSHALLTQESGSSVVVGLTSVYSDELINEPKVRIESRINSNEYPQNKKLTPEQLEELDSFRKKYGHQKYKLFYFAPKKKLKYSATVIECISLFFKWIYSSSFLFIHRESFLYFFLNNESNCEFVSQELIYAICALGAKYSPKPDVSSQAELFYTLSKSGLFGNAGENGFIKDSQITKLQSLLCLAFFDLGRGNFTSCWLLSGLAFRMGFDLGFELDPKFWSIPFNGPKWFLNPNNASSIDGSNDPAIERQTLFDDYPFDIKQVRSRIFWGSFVADRFICLVMGRPSSLKLSDTSIPDSQDIGDLTLIEDYVYNDLKSDKQYVCRGFDCLKAIISLYHISDDIYARLLKPVSDTGKLTRIDILSECNLKLLNWKQNLRKAMFWNKAILKKTAHNELCMSPRYTFFIIILSINRPFISTAMLKDATSVNVSSSVAICDDIIDDLLIVIKSLLSQKTSFGVFSPHLLSVYSTILAISCSFWMFEVTQNVTDRKRIKYRIKKCVNYLVECSKIWPLAQKPAEIFKGRLADLKIDSKLEEEAQLKSPILDKKDVGSQTFKMSSPTVPEFSNGFQNSHIVSQQNSSTNLSTLGGMLKKPSFLNLSAATIQSTAQQEVQPSLASTPGNTSMSNNSINTVNTDNITNFNYPNGLVNNHHHDAGIDESLHMASPTHSPNFEEIFDSMLNQANNQPFLLRPDLSDALWDVTFYETYSSMYHNT